MTEEFHYKCPYESTCHLRKHCHVLKTIKKLDVALPVVVKCPARNNREIVVTIGRSDSN